MLLPPGPDLLQVLVVPRYPRRKGHEIGPHRTDRTLLGSRLTASLQIGLQTGKGISASGRGIGGCSSSSKP